MGVPSGTFLDGVLLVPSRVVPHEVPLPLTLILDRTSLLYPPGAKEFCEIVADGRGRIRERPLFKVDGPCTDISFASFTECLENARTAVLERVFYHCVEGVFSRPVVPNYGRVCATFSPFWNKLRMMIRPSTPLTVLEYPATAYWGRRLRIYTSAAQRVHQWGVSRKHSQLKPFGKNEKIEICAKRAVPRMISPRSLEFNVEVGRYLRHKEHVIYKMVDSIFGFPTIMKGRNAFQVGELFSTAWASFRDPVAIGLDASRYDQHISKPLLQWEHKCYRAFYPQDKHLATLLRWQLENRGTMRLPDGTIRYMVEGGRCSGDMNTALGNCLIMTSAIYSYLHGLGIKPGLGRAVLFDNGDDCTVILERSNCERFCGGVPSFFGKLGLVMKVEPPVYRVEHVSFCQSRPVYDGRGWRMVREVRTSLSKDATIMDLRHATLDLSAQLYAVGECGLSLTGGLPILQAYYKLLQRGHSARGHVDPRFFETGFYHMSRGCGARINDVTDAARVSFYNAFGIVPDMQIAIEAEFDQCAPLGTGGVHHGAGRVTTLY